MRYFVEKSRLSANGSKMRAALAYSLLAGLALCVALTGCVAQTKTAQKAAQEPRGTSQTASKKASSSKKTIKEPPEEISATPINAPEKTDPAAASGRSGASSKDAPATPDAPDRPDAPPIDPRAMSTSIQQPADFNECVRVALVQSPLFVKSAIEIQSKRLDVQDAWAGFIPTLTISTTYWLTLPQTYTTGYQAQYDPISQSTTNVPVHIPTTTLKPYNINFSTSQWNPIVSGFDVAAKKEMVNMAILGHLQVISDGLHRLAADFLQLSALLDAQDIVQKKMEAANSNLEFFKTRQGLGQATQMDIRMAETRISMVKAEIDSLNAQRAQVTDDIKFIMGVPFANKLDLNVKGAKEEILGSFSAADVTDEKVRGHSFEMRLAGYDKSLQHKNIGLSFVSLLPTFGFTFQTLDSLVGAGQKTKDTFPFYPGINVSMPLNYLTKGRDIARQYNKLDQQRSTAKAKEFELMVTAQKALTDYQAAASDANLANSRMELAKLKDEQTEFHYKTGEVDYDKFVTDRADFYEAWQKMIMGKAKRDLALLALKDMTGDLQKQYIDVSSWEK